MAGLNDRRMLGTGSGALRRAARMVQRNGGNPDKLLQRAADAKLSEGSAISSSEDNINFAEKKRQLQSGLLAERRRATLGGDSAPPVAGIAPVQTGSTNASLNAARPGETASQARARFGESRTGVAAAPTGEAGTNNAGPPRSAMVTQPTGTVPPLSRPTLQGLPKPGLIDGKPAGSVLAGMRSGDTEPGNLTDLADRDTKDRADAIAAARSESSGNPSVTRYSVIDRLNKERVAGGRQPFGEDIYKDIAKQDGAASDLVAGRRALSAVATNVGQTAVTPLQKSLADAKTRFAPPPVEIQGPPSSAKPAEFQGPPSSAKPAASLSPAPPASGAFNLGAKIAGSVFNAMKSPDYSKPVLDSQGNPYTTRGFTPKPSLAGRFVAPSLTPEAERAKKKIKSNVATPVSDFGSGLMQGYR